VPWRFGVLRPIPGLIHVTVTASFIARYGRGTCCAFDLAAAVHLHRAVDVVEHPRSARRPDRPQDPLPVVAIGGVDRELADPLALRPGPRHQVHALQLSPRLGDRRGEFPERLLPRVELDADGDAVLR
jgi:hypothetical protein